MPLKPISLIVASALLIGCQANTDSLSDFVQQTELQARQKVEQLEPASEFMPMPYTQRMDRSPFLLPLEALVQNQPKTKKDCWQPSYRAKSGRLERFPISKLRLKGVMGSSGSISGLIQTPNGSVMKVKVGQYMGLNHGKVTRIENKYVLVKETIPDGLGCWQRRNVKLALR